MRPEDGKLDVERRVKHHVGILLVGRYPLFLREAHVPPLADGLAGAEGSLIVVADDATQQAVVAGGHPVVVVERDAGEGGDIHLELLAVGDALGEHGVKGMDTLDDEHGVVLELKLLAVELALAGHEVELWDFHPLTIHQAGEVVLKQVAVHRLDIVEVIVAVGQQRGVLAVDEVIVGRERQGPEAAGEQLD